MGKEEGAGGVGGFCCLVMKSCPTLSSPMNWSPLGSSVFGISQARILEWVAISFSRGSSRPRNQTHISYLLHWQAGFFFFFTTSANWEVLFNPESESKTESEVTQSCPTLCNPTDYSLPGSSVHGIFQARVLEWVAIAFSRGSS